MGFSITWCAVREADAQKLLNHFELSPTGEVEEFPESSISTAKLDTGWRIVWCNEYGSPFFKHAELSSISSECDVLLCLVEEHVMASSSEFWSGGERRWWISQEGEDGPKGLSSDGELPDNFPTTKADMEKAQLAEGGDDAEVDYIFEIPLKVAQSLVGFKHDEDCPHLTEDKFIVLSRAVSKKGWLSRLLGKRSR
jgi:hypothetical protein